MSQLSPAQLRRARKSFFVFNGLNSFSFILLSGSFITLYALRLGASNALVGALNAFGYITFFFLPLGKRLVKGMPIVKVFGWAWAIRYFAMLPALAAPILVAAGWPGPAFGLILAGVAGFNVARGVGLIGNNPVIAHLADGGKAGRRSDRGTFLVNLSIVSSLTGMAANLGVALILGKTASPELYAVTMGFGIAVGLSGSALLFKAPEPEDYRDDSSTSLWKNAREAMRDAPFRSFIGVFLVLSFASGMARSFLPVYAKEVFGQGDDAVMAYSLVASVGALAMGLLMRLLVDRQGAKPLYIIFTAISALSLAPLAIAGDATMAQGGILSLPLGAALLLGFVNFFSSFGFQGEETAGQSYFFALVKRERMLDLGVVYFLVYGIGGSLGAEAGGVILDLLGLAGFDHVSAYRIFYGFLFLVLVWVLWRMGRLVRLGSASVRESLEIMFSIRDLRTINLLSRLDRSGDPVEQVRLIQEVGSSASGRAQHELLPYLSSPRFDVRMEGLLALEKLRELGDEVEAALVAEVERQPFTTAYVAARILGKTGRTGAIPCLRRAALAQDYMLQGSAMIALARLGDRDSIGSFEELLERTENPRVRISAAYALELLGSRESVPILIACLRRREVAAFVSDELVLSTAAILGLMPRFYAAYTAFLAEEGAGVALLLDAAAEPTAPGLAAETWTLEDYRRALDAILADPADGAPMSRILLADCREGGPPEPGAQTQGQAGARPPTQGGAWQGPERRQRPRISPEPSGIDFVLAETALDPDIGYRGFRFFIAAYAALRARNPQSSAGGTARPELH
ncbi:MAG TPA: HEAT repeat domain-containing protein [Rectinemataceae bacterium]|nr:HEAT repeat domain-containing protein [Rectinemataceae bacterium]